MRGLEASLRFLGKTVLWGRPEPLQKGLSYALNLEEALVSLVPTQCVFHRLRWTDRSFKVLVQTRRWQRLMLLLLL